MDDPTRERESMDEPFTILLDDSASVVLETALTEYRNKEIMELNPDTGEKRRARHLHNRLRETHSLGAGATLTVNTDAEAQTLLNSLSHYSVEPAATYRQACVEELSGLLYTHSTASLADVPTITDFLEEDDDRLWIEPDDLGSSDEGSVPEIEVDITVKLGVGPAR